MVKREFTHLTPDEKINGIKASKLPDHIRSKYHGEDVREAIAQSTEMAIQLGINMGLSPDDAISWARKLQEAIPRSEFDSWVATLVDGGPSIFMNTLKELKATYPKGAAGVALVRETDPAKIYVWNGSAWEAFGDYQGIEIKDGAITSEKLSDKSVSYDKTTFMHISPSNLFDKNDVIPGTRFDAGGNEFADPKAVATKYIKVDKGNYIFAFPNLGTTSVSKMSRVPFYDKNKVFQSVVVETIISTRNSTVGTMPSSGYIRVGLNKDYVNDFVIAKEADYNGYQPFEYMTTAKAIPATNSVGSEQIKEKSIGKDKINFIGYMSNVFDKEVAKRGVLLSPSTETTDGASVNYFTSLPITDHEGGQWTINNVRAYRFSDLYGTKYGFVNTNDNSATVTLDVPKGHTFEFSGPLDLIDEAQANRGPSLLPYEPFAIRFSDELYIHADNVLGLDDKLSKDAGMNVVYNGNDLKVSDGELSQDLTLDKSRNGAFNFLYTYLNGVPVHSTGDDITPVRLSSTVGANHGWPLNTLDSRFDGEVTSGQLYPSIKNLEQKVTNADGVFRITEKYDILDNASILDHGVEYHNDLDAVESVARLIVTYEFRGSSKVTVYTTLIILKDTPIKNIGFLQSSPLGGGAIRYMPGVKPIGGYDFESGVNLSSYSSDLLIGSDSLNDVTKPPLFYSDVRNDLTFTMGYIPVKVGSSTERLQNTDTYWDLRATTKSYPVAIGTKYGSFEAGEVFEHIGFRNYSKPDKDLETFEVAETNDSYYIYIYSKDAMAYVTKLLDIRSDKEVVIVQSSGFELLGEGIVSNSITFNVSAKGYAVLKVDK